MVMALDLRLRRSWVRVLAVKLSYNNLRQVVHIRASFVKQYNFGIGLASHWLCVTNLCGLSTCGLKA